MIVDERMVTYMNSLDKGNTPFLKSSGTGGTEKSCAHYPKRNAEFFEGASADKSTETYFRGGDRSGVFHPSYEHI